MSKEFAVCLPDWTVRTLGPRDPLPATDAAGPVWVDEGGFLTLSRIANDAGERYRLRLADELSVDISFTEQLVCEHSASDCVPQSTRQHFLADQVLPRILGHKGKLVLHGAAVQIGHEAIVLLGKSGSGKSTLAASFDREGNFLLGDDALVVSWRDGIAHVRAVYSSLRLFPDSIDALFSEDVPTTSVAHYTPKLRVSVPINHGGVRDALPVRALFAIGPPLADSTIHIARKSIANACMAVVENSFVLDPTDTVRAPERLQNASRLASQVWAFDLCFPRAYSRLSDVRAAILATLD